MDIRYKCLRPSLKIFIGADIIGSTALKQSQTNFEEDTGQEQRTVRWFDIIRDFYRISQYEFLSEWKEKKSQSSCSENHYGDDPILWKTIGDEVIFVKNITDHRQVTTIINCWKKAVLKINNFFDEKNLPNLKIKCVCWTAGFPILNREIAIQRSEGASPPPPPEEAEKLNYLKLEEYHNKTSSDITVDHIGPSIDTGFRLSAYATKRKLILSVDVAYLLSCVREEEGIGPILLYYDGSFQLKGVTGGSEYPIFWISVSDEEIYTFEDKINCKTPLDTKDLEKYCNSYYKSRNKFTFRPFIKGETGVLGSPPAWYETRLVNIQKNLCQEDAVDAVEPDSSVVGGETMTRRESKKLTKELTKELT